LGDRVTKAPSVPGFAIPEGPVGTVDIDHVDHDIVGTDAKLLLQFVGDEAEEGKLGRLVVADRAGDLDKQEVRRAVEAEELGIVDQVLFGVFADDDEAIAIRGFQDIDDAPLDDVSDGGAVLGGLSLDQIDTCEGHDGLL
jgi:hypothetical protein